MEANKTILFIAWDGESAHYMQGLFLPIFSRLLKHGYKVEVLHLSSIPAEKLEKVNDQADGYGMIYHPITIQRSISGFLKAIKAGKNFLKAFQKTNPGQIIMPRSYMPALLLRMAGLRNATLVYDMDGLALDERLDFAGWSTGSLKYKFFRKLEQWTMRRAKALMVRSQRSKAVISGRYGFLNEADIFKVINGKDEQSFRPLEAEKRESARAELGLTADEILLIYCGTIAPQYCLDEMLQCFEMIRQKEVKVKFMILTGQQDQVRAHAKFIDFEQDIVLQTVAAAEVPEYLGAADLGLALRKPTFSMQGVAPIKIGEYLLCGLPVICSKGIGDTETELSGQGSVMVVDECSKDELQNAVNQFILNRQKGAIAPLDDCVALGGQLYSLDAAEKSYMSALDHAK